MAVAFDWFALAMFSWWILSQKEFETFLVLPQRMWVWALRRRVWQLEAGSRGLDGQTLVVITTEVQVYMALEAISHFQPTSIPGGLFNSSKSTSPWLLRWAFRNFNSPKLIGRKLPVYLFKGLSSLSQSLILQQGFAAICHQAVSLCALECSLGWFDVYFTCPFLVRKQFQVRKRGSC